MSTRNFKSSGPIGMNEIKIFIDGDEASAVHSNIKLGTMFSEAQSLTPQPAVLPNGDFVTPHSMSEFYDASILTSSIQITSIEEAVYDLILNVNSPAGSASAASGAGTYSPGTVVNISASFNSSSEEFTSWSGGTVASSTSATTTVTMDGDVTLTANIGVKQTPLVQVPGRVLPGQWKLVRFGGHGGGLEPVHDLYGNQDIDVFNIWAVDANNTWRNISTTTWTRMSSTYATNPKTGNPLVPAVVSVYDDVMVSQAGHHELTAPYILADFFPYMTPMPRATAINRYQPAGWGPSFYVGQNNGNGTYSAPTAQQISAAALL